MPILITRADKVAPGAGTTPPTAIPNNAIFALFGLIGVVFIIAGIWFFFWAPNGGFHFKDGDWEDYKSTVLRRKGPNGTTLSGATRTTDLGGGSVVGKRYRDSESSLGTQSEMSEIKSLSASQRGGRRSKPVKAKKEKKEKKERSRPHDEEMGEQENHQEEPEEVIRAYRHEKPARVGGLNRLPDGSSFEGSTQDSHSDLLSNREKTPTNTPTKKKRERRDNYTGGSSPAAGIRKVNTTSTKPDFWNPASSDTTKSSTSGRSAAETQRIKAEARKLQEKGRGARRDFSYTVGDDGASKRAGQGPPPRVPGGFATESEVGSEVSGTKSYHHPIPGLGGYAEEKRKARAAGAGAGGYRRGARGARDELSDSDGN